MSEARVNVANSTTIKLRGYQQLTLNLVWDYLNNNKTNPCLVLPTGAGKSIIIAALVRDAIYQYPPVKVLLLTHQQELVEQDAEKLIALGIDISIFSAGLGKKELGQVTCASVQSLYNKRFDLDAFNILLVDEAHMISHEDTGRYRVLINQLLLKNPNIRIIGLTATPYRLGHGYITDKPAIFDDLIEPVNVRMLQNQGYLAKLTSKATSCVLDVTGAGKRGGDYIESDLQRILDTDLTNAEVVNEVVAKCGPSAPFPRKSWLIFCTGINHAENIKKMLVEKGINTACITGNTDKRERAETLALFKEGKITAITNANVLTTGFDAPNVDLIVMLRPTLSPGLYCLSMDTEILTDTGWVSYEEALKSEYAYSYNHETKEIFLNKIKGVLKRKLNPTECFYSFNGQLANFRITNKHNMLFRTKRQGFRFDTAEKMATYRDGVYIPVAGNISNFSGVNLTDNELRFVAWVITDGSINKKHKAINISQKTGSKYEDEIEKTIQACGLKYGKHISKGPTNFIEYREQTIFSISYGKPRGRDKEKKGWAHLEQYIDKNFPKILHNMTNDQFEIFLDICNKADGSKNIPKDYVRQTLSIGKGNKSFIDNLQIAAICRGYRANISYQQRIKPFYVLHIKKQDFVCVNSQHDNRTKIQKEEFGPEDCWCIETEHGTIITRHKGKPTIMGNCQICGRGLRIAEGKTNCLVLDFAGNVSLHGPITDVTPPRKKRKGEGLAPCKTCPECLEIVHTSVRVCPECGYEFPKKEKLWTRDGADVSGETQLLLFPLASWRWEIGTAKNGNPMLIATYTSENILADDIREYFCLWHDGWAGAMASKKFNALLNLYNISVDMFFEREQSLLKLNTFQIPKDCGFTYIKKKYVEIQEHIGPKVKEEIDTVFTETFTEDIPF